MLPAFALSRKTRWQLQPACRAIRKPHQIFLGINIALALSFLLPFQLPAAAQEGLQPKSVQSPASAQPSVVSLALTPKISIDTEIIQRPDGGFSIPVKTFAAFFGIEVQQSEEDRRLFFVDPDNRKRVDIYWEQQRITVDDQEYPVGAIPMIRSQKGFLVQDDVYLDQALFSALFQAKMTLDNDTGILTLSTDRKLKLPVDDATDAGRYDTENNIRLIRKMDISRSPLEKIYIRHTSNYGFQDYRQPINARIQQSNFNAMVDTSTIGASGSILGLDYRIKPSITRYNNKSNFQSIDWSFQREIKNNVISLGSTDAGLSPLSSPSLGLWGLKFASRNALSPFLSPQSNYEFSGKASSGNQVTMTVNNRNTQTVVARDNSYEFEPVYLQGQAITHVRITEKDAQNREHLLLEKDIAYFSNMLPKGETAYSLFMGRTPLQFYPLIPDQKTPLLMPQTEKWLTGGRLFYGINNRLTLGLSAVADQTFGKPKTYFTSLNPLSMDLTGFSSYQRDPNFFSGQNASLSLRYQLTDRWLLSSDAGISHYSLKPGSRLPISDTDFGKAGQLHLERQGALLSWYMDAFHYDSSYYTPSVTLYGNNLYDKQGIGGGVSGAITKFFPIAYNFNWKHYQTNLQQLIAGGVINTNHWGGTINSQINEHNNMAFNFSLIDGQNHAREFLQRSLDLTWHTQSLPWHLQGDIRASHYYTNTLFLPSKTLGTNLVESNYTNNGLDTSILAPLGKSGNTIKLGHRWSSFVDYGFVQGFFQFRRIFFEPFAQLSYGDKPQLQDRMGVRLGYQFKSGARISVSYYKIASSFRDPAGIAPRSQIKTNQFYFDFGDVLGLLANRLQSLGPNAETAGIVTGKVFADYQADGKWNKSEPGIKNVQLLVDKNQVVTTDQQGRFRLSALAGGYHTIEVLPEQLPLTLSAENPIYKVKVIEGKNHQLNIALTPEGGSLSGKLNLVDGRDQKLEPKDITLVLRDQSGNSVKYTAVDAQGRYKFSNIPMGRYRIDLESRLKNSGRYKIMTLPEEVELAPVQDYEQVCEIKNLDIKLMAL